VGSTTPFLRVPASNRFYDPEEVVSAIRDRDPIFPLPPSLFHSWSIFEAALDRMNAHLAKLGYLEPPPLWPSALTFLCRHLRAIDS